MVDYELYVRCELGRDDARARLGELSGMHINAYGLGVRDGMTLDASEWDLRADRIEHSFGFRPTLLATFRPEEFVDKDTYFTNLRLLLEAATTFVVEQDVQAVLLVTGGTVLFQRLGDVVELNNQYAEWLALEVADGIPEPKHFASLESPLVAKG